MATGKGLLKMNCLNNTIEPSKVAAPLVALAGSDEGAYFVLQASRHVYRWNQEEDKCECVLQGTADKLVYNRVDKTLWCSQWYAQGESVMKINSATGAQSFRAGDITAMCGGPDNSIHVGMTGALQKWDAAGNVLENKDVSSRILISSMKCDPVTGTLYACTLYACTGANGFIRECDTHLRNDRKIEYGDIYHATVSFEYDFNSKFLCILSHNNGDDEDAHQIYIFPPYNKNIKHMLPFNCKHGKCACDPLTNTFYIAGKDKIGVLKPKSSYLALINSSAFTVLKMLLHMNNQAALEGELL